MKDYSHRPWGKVKQRCISLILTHNSSDSLNLTTEAYFMEWGPHYTAYAELRESKLCTEWVSKSPTPPTAKKQIRFCPKPRRFGALNPSIHGFRLLPPSPPLRRYQFDVVDDSRAGAELYDLILSKSPPFYSGSPPSRATNPVIEDAEFGTQNKLGFSPLPPAAAAAAATTSAPPLSATTSASP
ncbi:hypothetical protein LINPERPRIM_LOCUS183 [Linum perenne]